MLADFFFPLSFSIKTWIRMVATEVGDVKIMNEVCLLTIVWYL